MNHRSQAAGMICTWKLPIAITLYEWQVSEHGHHVRITLRKLWCSDSSWRSWSLEEKCIDAISACKTFWLRPWAQDGWHFPNGAHALLPGQQSKTLEVLPMSGRQEKWWHHNKQRKDIPCSFPLQKQQIPYWVVCLGANLSWAGHTAFYWRLSLEYQPRPRKAGCLPVSQVFYHLLWMTGPSLKHLHRIWRSRNKFDSHPVYHLKDCPDRNASTLNMQIWSFDADQTNLNCTPCVAKKPLTDPPQEI